MMPGDPVVGSTILRRPAVQSPNFATGVSGWTINSDGSAEFNNLVIRGTFNGTDFVINSAGMFLYSGTPAKGSLIMAVSPAVGTDAFGNNYGQGFNVGTWSASTGNMLQHFGIDDNGNVYVASSTGATVAYIQSSTGAFLTYTSAGQAAGTLISSVSPVDSTDPFGNHYLSGMTSYGGGVATQMDSGQVSIYTGSLAAGWTSAANILLSAGVIELITSGGVITSNNTLDNGAGGATFNGHVTITGTLSVNGSTSTTTNGLPNGGIIGTSGGASAGTAHTHGPGSFSVSNGQHAHTL